MEPYTYRDADRSWPADGAQPGHLGNTSPMQPLGQSDASAPTSSSEQEMRARLTELEAQARLQAQAQAYASRAPQQPQQQVPAAAPNPYADRVPTPSTNPYADRVPQQQAPAGYSYAAAPQQAPIGNPYADRAPQQSSAANPYADRVPQTPSPAPNPYDNYDEFFYGPGTEMPRRKHHPIRTVFALLTAAALAMMLWPQSPVNYDILRGTSLHNLQEWAEQTLGFTFPQPTEEELEAIYSQDSEVDTEFLLSDPPTALDSTATAFHYYRSTLDEHAKTVYDSIEAGLINMDEKISIPAGTSTEELHTCWQFVLFDRSDIFWLPDDARLTYFTWGDSVAYIVPDYKYDPETANALKAQFEEIAEVTPLLGDTPEQTMANICTFVADYTDYANSENDQYIDSVFANRSSVCAGYSKAVQYLAVRHGIPCIYIVGTAADYLGTGGSHAWVAANINGEVRYYDPTWYDQRGWHADQFLNMNLVDISADHQSDYPQLLPR